jgi:hypothetical protein
VDERLEALRRSLEGLEARLRADRIRDQFFPPLAVRRAPSLDEPPTGGSPVREFGRFVEWFDGALAQAVATTAALHRSQNANIRPDLVRPVEGLRQRSYLAWQVLSEAWQRTQGEVWESEEAWRREVLQPALQVYDASQQWAATFWSRPDLTADDRAQPLVRLWPTVYGQGQPWRKRLE